ncbi:MAG TPA: hypothetical protein VGA30_04835 [Actinomycetota bacterium]
MTEDEVRAMLESKAQEFRMPALLPGRVRVGARRRMSVRAAVAVTAVVGTAAAVLTLGGWGKAGPADRQAQGKTPAARTDLLKLVDRAVPVSHQGDTQGDTPVTKEQLRGYVACMWAQGFDLPDPTYAKGRWTIQVAPADINLDSKRWREAALVTCRPPGTPPISGDLVLGRRSRSEVQAFTTCMRRHGFPLPDPVWNGDSAVFDLKGTAIDVDSTAGREAVFVTCAPAPLTP